MLRTMTLFGKEEMKNSKVPRVLRVEKGQYRPCSLGEGEGVVVGWGGEDIGIG